MAWSRFFRDDEKLEAGDTVKITSLWDRIDYKVIDTKLIYPDDISDIYTKWKGYSYIAYLSPMLKHPPKEYHSRQLFQSRSHCPYHDSEICYGIPLVPAGTGN